MTWDEPSLELKALMPAQLTARAGTKKVDRARESALVDFDVHGTNLVSGDDPLQLILVRRDLRVQYLANQGEIMLGGLRPADIIPLIEVETDANGRSAKAKALIRERAPGAYDLIAFRSPKIDGDNIATNEATVLRSALVILEPV